MGENKELMEAFATSIKMEEDGRQFYLEAAKRSANELGKKVFEALADDETRHIVAIREYSETMAKKGATPELSSVMPTHKNINDRLIFGKKKSELLKNVNPEADELKAYEMGMQLENDGQRFYKETLESANDPNVKELYKFLLSEEENHFEILSSTYEYLKNPAAWFANEEKPIVEG